MTRPHQNSGQLFPSTSRQKQKPKPLAKVEPKPAPAAPVAGPLTPAQLREAARNVKALQDARAAWQLGDQRDAENPCKYCGGERVEILCDVREPTDPKEKLAWEVRCMTCRPMAEQ